VTEILRENLFWTEHPANISLAIALAKEYLKLNQTEQALAMISQCIDTLGSHPELMREKGHILLRQGEYRAAALAYLQYIEASPFDPGIRDYRSFITVHLLRKQLLQNRNF
jgi:regulator of sirC expression with transglutaminase-like and TPR domain